MVVLQEAHAGPVPGMHSVESVEAEQRRWDIGSAIILSLKLIYLLLLCHHL